MDQPNYKIFREKITLNMEEILKRMSLKSFHIYL